MPTAPQEHPAYIHALSDLRYARALLDVKSYPDVTPQTEKAVREIDTAINDIKQASIDDHKDLNDHPPIDAQRKPHERFQDAIAALNRAHADAARAEDDPKAKGLRVAALHDIDAARINAQQAMDKAVADYNKKQ